MGKLKDWIRRRALLKEAREPHGSGLNLPTEGESPCKVESEEKDSASENKMEEKCKTGEMKGKKPANRAYMVVEDIPTGE